jgi:uncharacterized membrane protein YbhN (UPF0104 family)
VYGAARSWAVLLGRSDKATMRVFFDAQLTKYLPAGSAVQAATQVGLARAEGLPTRRVVTAFALSMLCPALAGLALSSTLVFSTELPGVVRAVSLLGLAAPAFVQPGLLRRVLHVAERWTRRAPDPTALPPPESVRRALVLSVLNIGLYGAAYLVLLRAFDGEAPIVGSFAGFVAAWTLGFLAVPIPAGVGIREALLVFFVPGVDSGPLLAASLVHRLLGMAAEVVLAVTHRLRGSR